MTDPMTAMQSIRMQAMWNAYRSSFSSSGQAGSGAHLELYQFPLHLEGAHAHFFSSRTLPL